MFLIAQIPRILRDIFFHFIWPLPQLVTQCYRQQIMGFGYVESPPGCFFCIKCNIAKKDCRESQATPTSALVLRVHKNEMHPARYPLFSTEALREGCNETDFDQQAYHSLDGSKHY